MRGWRANENDRDMVMAIIVNMYLYICLRGMFLLCKDSERRAECNGFARFFVAVFVVRGGGGAKRRDTARNGARCLKVYVEPPLLRFLYDDGRVVSAETECVGECGADCALLCLVEREVQTRVDVRVVVAVLVVDGGRDDVVFHREHGYQCFECARCAEQMASHGLGG